MRLYISSYSSDCACFKCQYDITLVQIIIRFYKVILEFDLTNLLRSLKYMYKC